MIVSSMPQQTTSPQSLMHSPIHVRQPSYSRELKQTRRRRKRERHLKM